MDRLFSNTGVDIWKLFGNWVPFVIADRPEVVVALDWADFDQDNQSTVALYLVTKHGRACSTIPTDIPRQEDQGSADRSQLHHDRQARAGTLPCWSATTELRRVLLSVPTEFG